jgi:hypothetical protein
MEPVAAAAAANWHTPQPIVETLTFEDERVNRYVWYAGEDLPWPEIHGGWIKRCRVTPILPFLIWERINDVPEDMRKAVRKDWMDRTHQEAQYEIRPAGIFNSIMEQYGALGVIELTALRGKPEQEVLALNISTTFCPWHGADIPKPYREIKEQIEKVLRTASLNATLRSVGEEMLASIEASKAYDEQFVDAEESQKELKYSKPGLRALSRLDRRRRDHALTDLAEADLAAKRAAAQTSSDQSALVAEMAEQNRLKREELELRREELELNRQMMAKGKPGRPPKQAEVDA